MFSLDPSSRYFFDTLNFFLKIIGGGGGLYLFLIGIKRYYKDQNWKRNEFVAKEIKEFTSDIIVRNMMYMLDWGSRYIELFPNAPNYDDRFVKVDRNILKSALQNHKFKIDNLERFTKIEVAIRDSFDHFLSYFERFEHFIEADLITVKELKPYMKYWVNTISGDMEEDVRNFIFHYINEYGFIGTQNFFKSFNEDIIPKTNLESTRIIELPSKANPSLG